MGVLSALGGILRPQSVALAPVPVRPLGPAPRRLCPALPPPPARDAETSRVVAHAKKKKPHFIVSRIPGESTSQLVTRFMKYASCNYNLYKGRLVKRHENAAAKARRRRLEKPRKDRKMSQMAAYWSEYVDTFEKWRPRHIWDPPKAEGVPLESPFGWESVDRSDEGEISEWHAARHPRHLR